MSVRKWLPWIVSISVLIVGSLYLWVLPETRSTTSITFENGQTVEAMISDDDAERAQGLAGVEKLTDEEGMLFLHDDREIRSYWMKGMVIPIDIIWIDGEEIVGVVEEVQVELSDDLTTYQSNAPSNRVLEVRAGFIREYGVRVGDRLDIQSL